MSEDTAAIIVVAVAIAIGIVGTVLPILPGLWLIWLATLVYGLMTDFGWLGWTAMGVITALAVAGTAAAILLPQRGAARAGVSLWGQALALVGAIMGFFLLPVVGAVIGFAFGILVAALLQNRDVGVAWAATKATLRGMLLASGMQLVVAVAMAAVWVGWVVWA